MSLFLKATIGFTHLKVVAPFSFLHCGSARQVRADSPSPLTSQVTKFFCSVARVRDRLSCLVSLDSLATLPTPPILTKSAVEERRCAEFTI